MSFAGTRSVTYTVRELDELELAWATTVHKAQGGEVPVVVLALSVQYGPILSRRLLYTGQPKHEYFASSGRTAACT